VLYTIFLQGEKPHSIREEYLEYSITVSEGKPVACVNRYKS